jgi:hypothetical protein
MYIILHAFSQGGHMHHGFIPKSMTLQLPENYFVCSFYSFVYNYTTLLGNFIAPLWPGLLVHDIELYPQGKKSSSMQVLAIQVLKITLFFSSVRKGTKMYSWLSGTFRSTGKQEPLIL